MKGNIKTELLIVGMCLFAAIALLYFYGDFKPSSTHSEIRDSEDKSLQVANFIQSKVNTEGYTECRCRPIGDKVVPIVQCDLNFPVGTSRYTVIANTQGVADMFAQVGALASTIYYTGYSGSQKVCEFQYDMYSTTVTRKL